MPLMCSDPVDSALRGLRWDDVPHDCVQAGT